MFMLVIHRKHVRTKTDAPAMTLVSELAFKKRAISSSYSRQCTTLNPDPRNALWGERPSDIGMQVFEGLITGCHGKAMLMWNLHLQQLMHIHTTYFDQASSEHTSEVVAVVREFLQSNPSIDYVLVATTQGDTGIAVAQALKGKKVVAVSHQAGFAAPNENELGEDKRNQIERLGGQVLTTTHAFAGVARGIRKALGTWEINELLAVAYRTFGQGTKVCAEIAMMAADAGLVPTDKDVICIAGTGRGADTAWLVRPANTSSFPDLKMRACLCKPAQF